jgi:RNA polymerase sigma-70 factor (ECF subfamily)
VLDALVDSDILEAIEDLPEPYAEMAEIMDVPMGTVMSRLHRGRRALQKRLWDLARDRGIVKGAGKT